jgi:hypothetical protein
VGGKELLTELLRSWQLPHKLNGGGGAALLAWSTTAASPQITMEIHISNWTHKFQNRTGLDAKTNLQCSKFSYLAGMSPYISLKIKKRHYEHHMIEAHK